MRRRLMTDSAEAPVLHQPQLPSHGRQGDGGRVQPDAHRRAHPHRPVQVHSFRPVPDGEDRGGEAQLQVQSRHRLNFSAPVPPDHSFLLHRQVRLHETGSAASSLNTKKQKFGSRHL